MKRNYTHHQLKIYKSYTPSTVAGILIVLGLLMLLGISNFPKNLILSVTFFSIAFINFIFLKTTKPVTISDNLIILGKFVKGFKEKIIEAKTVDCVELIAESKKEFSPAAKYTGGEIEVFSNYYRLKLKDKSEITFDNEYDENMKSDLKKWCQNHNIRYNLDIKIVTE